MVLCPQATGVTDERRWFPDPRELGNAPETPDLQGAYPRLTDAQIEALAAYGEQRGTEAGQLLFREGDFCDEFIVVLRGKVAVVVGDGVERQVIRVHGARRFLGELGLIEGQPSYFSGVMCEPGELLAVPVSGLRQLVAQDTLLGDLILRAYLIRRTMLIGLGAGFRLIGSAYSADTTRLREFAARNRLPYWWVNLEQDQEAERLLRSFSIGVADTPVVIWAGTRVLRNPSNAELAKLLGLRPAAESPAECDVLVIGAGPAGLAAAVYGASDGLRTVVTDAIAAGGRASTSPRIENYLGFPSGISGTELAERAVIQASKFGAQVSVPAEAVGLAQQGADYVVRFADRADITARTVIIASGVHYRRLDVPGLAELEGTSVYYAATLHEARLCGSDPVVVVGGGNAAGQASLFLAHHASQVYLVVREPELGEYMSRYLVDEVRKQRNVRALCDREVVALRGERALSSVVVRHNPSGRHCGVDARAMFVFIGARPRTEWLSRMVARDDRGFVLTGTDAISRCEPAEWDRLHRQCMSLETNRPGIFAAGDIRTAATNRVAAAVGDGALAIRQVHEHLS